MKELNLLSNTTSFKRYDEVRPVLGIIEDFNYRPLHEKIEPVMIGQMDEQRYPWQIFVKVSDDNLIETVDRIIKTQANFIGEIPMESGFVDDTINKR